LEVKPSLKVLFSDIKFKRHSKSRNVKIDLSEIGSKIRSGHLTECRAEFFGEDP